MIVITLNKSDILYDIGNIAYITGNFIADVIGRSFVQDINSEGNADRITRILNKSYGELVYGLTAYTRKPMSVVEDVVESVSEDNSFVDPSSYSLSFDVPETFSKPNINAVATACHEFMVNKALYEWFSITKKDEADLYRIKADQEMANMKRYLNSRTKAVRRPLRSF